MRDAVGTQAPRRPTDTAWRINPASFKVGDVESVPLWKGRGASEARATRMDKKTSGFTLPTPWNDA